VAGVGVWAIRPDAGDVIAEGRGEAEIAAIELG